MAVKSKAAGVATAPRRATKEMKEEIIATPVRRVVIENVRPEIDCGRFPIKRTVGQTVEVTADIHADGHDVLRAVLLQRPASQRKWHESEMEVLVNDEWRGRFSVDSLEPHLYTVEAWVDPFATWARDIGKKFDAGQDVSVDLLVGVALIEAAAGNAPPSDARRLKELAAELRGLSGTNAADAVERVRSEEVLALMKQHPDRAAATRYHKELAVNVDRAKAGFSAWYEMFPRSCAREPERHGTFDDCIRRLDYVAGMGFDVLYLPPIHPIGVTARKGKNNQPQCSDGDVGSPWAIGGAEGGHTAIHPQLGTLQDFQRLIRAAREKGLEIALDIAFQCTPDHPYVKQNREWFRIRPDGTVQYAENPPKKYQDIYPLQFEGAESARLCRELRDVMRYWIDQGVRIFRVDNPHTKPYAFWEWAIGEIRRDFPDVIFLSEAFTRPKVMYRLAKLGFTQSYTYFAWRNTKRDLTQYFTELTQSEVREFFRPNLWPNTPDILTEYLQHGGRPAFMSRLVLAATLGANYGIYGPAFELCENRAIRQGSEEYLDSEKYQIRHWDIDRADSLKDLIARVNSIRRENPALQRDQGLRFHNVDNEQIIAYSKATDDLSNIVLTVVNLDPHHTQSGWLEFPRDVFNLDPHQPYQAHDLLTDERYLWSGSHNYVELNPGKLPAHIFRIRRLVRRENDFDYFM